MSTLKTLTTSLTAAALVTGISLAWAQSEDQSQPTNTTTAAGAMPSEQTPADPNAVPLTDNAATMQQQNAPTNPPAVDGTTPAPMSSDANSQAPLNNPANTANTTSTMDNSTSATPSPDANTSSTYEPAPRADRN